MGLSKKLILTSEKDFSNILKNGSKYVSPLFIMFSYPANNGEPQFGIIASKKVGKAHQRNRAKRLLREAIRANIESFPKNLNYVFISRTSLVEVNVHEVNEEFERMLTKINK